MADIEIGDAVAAGFGLIRREPLSVLAWGLLSLAGVAFMVILIGPGYASFFAQAAEMSKHPDVKPDMTAFTQQMLGVQGAVMLANLVVGFARVMIYCAALRAIIHPGQKRFAFLRIGAPELFFFVLEFAFGVAAVFAIMVPALIVVLVVAGLVAAHAVAIAVVIAVAAVIGLIYGLVYVMLRLAFVGPMMVADGQFHLFDAWALTKGRTLNLFVIGITLLVAIMVAEGVLGLVSFVAAAGYVGSATGGFAHLAEMIRSDPQALLGKVAPVLVVISALWTLFYGAAMAVLCAPWAKAYKDVAGPDTAAVFA